MSQEPKAARHDRRLAAQLMNETMDMRRNRRFDSMFEIGPDGKCRLQGRPTELFGRIRMFFTARDGIAP